MYNQNLISVIMGIYNCADTLTEAVNSIIEQTYTNWELIMCDDGSTDDTYKLALELSKTDDRIKVIKNDRNLSLAPTLNNCIKYTSGKYIARMDGDDVCDRTRFQKEYDFLETHSEYSLVGCNIELFDNSGVYRTINYRQNPTIKNLAKGSQFCHASIMMRTEDLLKIGCYNTDDKYYRIEDYWLWVKFYEYGFKGFNIGEVLYSMRDDQNAIRRRNFKNRLNEAKIMFYICRTFNLSFRYYLNPLKAILKFFVPTFVYKYIHKMKK